MIGRLLRAAYILDAWLRRRLGRPYTMILGWGLVASVFGALSNLGQTLKSGGGLLKIGALVVLQLALLVNLLAQLHEHREDQRKTKAAKAAKGAPDA